MITTSETKPAGLPGQNPDFRGMSLELLKRFPTANLSDTNLRRYWAARSTAHLKGKKVDFVGYTPMEGNREQCPVIVFTDGSTLHLQCDPEGNGPGSGLFVNLDERGAVCEDCISPA